MVGLSDNVPVKYRRWLWEKTLDAATDLIALIVYAWDEQNVAHKVVYIDRALTKFTVLNTYMRLCNEARVLHIAETDKSVGAYGRYIRAARVVAQGHG